jgi:hypothetical protein
MLKRDALRDALNLVTAFFAVMFVAVVFQLVGTNNAQSSPVLAEESPVMFWPRCTTVTVVLDHNSAAHEDELRRYVAELAASTGLDLRYAGMQPLTPMRQWLTTKTNTIAVTWNQPDLLYNRDSNLGVAYRLTDPVTGDLSSVFVVINARETRSADIRRKTLLHEHGHALGLNHNDNPDDLMHPYIGPDSDDDISPDDLAQLQDRYRC